MASITTRKNGSRFIGFVDENRKLQTITLGKVPLRYAESVRVKVEDLVSASITGHAPADETSRWLAGLDDRMIGKLARVGLTAPRQTITLKEWLTLYLDQRRADLKPESHRKLCQTRDKLLAYFDAQTPVRSITTRQASEWRQWLRGQVSEAWTKTLCGNVKTVFAEAVRHKVIPENPFIYLRSGSTPSKHTRYITPDEIDKVIDTLPTAEWRLLVGLARYAGLRIPSESHTLMWGDVDFERRRLTVRSRKTEHHAGHEQRFVPVTPKLMQLLQDRFDECGAGDRHLVTIRGQGRISLRMQAACARAGVESWPRLWQTLRASCEKEWAMTFPQYAVSKWIGHSITVSGRHYANDVPDELFDWAAGIATGAQRYAQRKAHATARKDGKEEKTAERDGGRISLGCESLQQSSVSLAGTSDWWRADLNRRPAGYESAALDQLSYATATGLSARQYINPPLPVKTLDGQAHGGWQRRGAGLAQVPRGAVKLVCRRTDNH